MDYYSSHYAQAYAPVVPQPQQPLPARTSFNAYASMSSWYQSGHTRCSHPGCSFLGSQGSVETHMMDRHLIFPPGWHKLKKKPEWDADPSLKGKPVPIQGTSIILDTPEAIDAWIAERKRRFPTASLVEEKKRRMDEAVARGQLDFRDSRSRKRHRPEDKDDGRSDRSRKRRVNTNANAGPSSGPLNRVPANDSQPMSEVPAAPQHDGSSDDDDDGAPETLSSKMAQQGHQPEHKSTQQLKPQKYSSAPLPKPKPRNPFKSRPTLLRNLLLPEIAVTLSNFSQAVRFLVDNNFLDNVELVPGQAVEQNRIEVIHEQT